MQAQEFLKAELKSLSEIFPKVNFRYGFDEIIDVHVVEINPLEQYYSNKELDDAWVPIALRFLETYETEEIVFISSDSSLKIENSVFEFNKLKISTEEDLISELYSDLANKEMPSYTFTERATFGSVINAQLAVFLATSNEREEISPKFENIYTYANAA